jgi:2-methylcitrate dehydratase PrpD
MAQFSVQFLVAAMFVKGYVNLDTVYFEPLNNPKIVALAKKIDWTLDKESDYPVNFPGEVRVVMKDGRKFSRRERFNRGGPRNPLSQEEIVDKFMDNACRVISVAKAKRIAALIGGLEKVEDVSQLAKLYK